MAANTQDAFRQWRRECQLIQEEMDQLLRAGCPESELEQQQRRNRFQELIQRREAAARLILPPKKPSNLDQDDGAFKTAV